MEILINVLIFAFIAGIAIMAALSEFVEVVRKTSGTKHETR